MAPPTDAPGFDQPLHHQAFADPYDPGLRRALLDAARRSGVTAHDGGAMVVINGPRFSTEAESRWFREMGWSVVNMTGMPEAVLAAEAGMRPRRGRTRHRLRRRRRRPRTRDDGRRARRDARQHRAASRRPGRRDPVGRLSGDGTAVSVGSTAPTIDRRVR
ncbi:MAG: hypothetical protein R2697_09395 [Ilumatobacteraceae bacterium]